MRLERVLGEIAVEVVHDFLDDGVLSVALESDDSSKLILLNILQIAQEDPDELLRVELLHKGHLVPVLQEVFQGRHVDVIGGE